jgi:hypothetical protein
MIAESFPEQTDFDNIVFYFHNIKRDDILSFQCIENVSLGIRSDLEEVERNENRMVTTKVFGYYLSENSLEQARFISYNNNGTLILTSINASG